MYKLYSPAASGTPPTGVVMSGVPAARYSMADMHSVSTNVCMGTVGITPISESVTRLWTFEGEREFDYPFLKNSQGTDKVAS